MSEIGHDQYTAPPTPERWAATELAGPLQRLNAYSEVLNPPTGEDEEPTPIPTSLEELCAMQSPDQRTRFTAKVEQLHLALEKIRESGATGPDGSLLSEGMHLVPVPWAALKRALKKRGNASENVYQWNEWHYYGGREQGDALELKDDGAWYTLRTFIKDNAELPEIINHSDAELFGQLDPDDEDDSLRYRNPEDPSELLTVDDYLAKRLELDGPVGVMLLQTEGAPGVSSGDVDDVNYNHSADSLTQEGRSHVIINGVPIDGLGIVESLAYALSADPTTFAGGDDMSESLLLANRNTAIVRPNPFTEVEKDFVGAMHISFTPAGTGKGAGTLEIRLTKIAAAQPRLSATRAAYTWEEILSNTGTYVRAAVLL